ncbi:MAG: hypothetical protein ACRD2I_26865 [Vicinamibacterales bacterium]
MRLARAAAAASFLTCTLAGCANGPEFALITQFFSASRLRDLTALRSFSTVVFEPAVDGTVAGFEIKNVAAVEGPDGRPMTKEVSIAASVRLPSGETATKDFVISLSRGVPGSDQYRLGRWMIVAIRADRASASTPPP